MPLPTVSHVPYWESDEWDFSASRYGKRDCENLMSPLDLVAFVSVPTREEVEEATRDFQDALQLCGKLAPVPEPQVESTSPNSAAISFNSGEQQHLKFPSNTQGPVSGENEPNQCGQIEKILALDWPVKPPSMGSVEGQLTQPGGRSATVLEALSQLQCNPPAWSMFMSIATNKAVWESVLKVEHVQEFMQHYGCNPLDSKVFACNGGDQAKKSHAQGKSSRPNIFVRAFRCTKSAVSKFIDSIMEAMLDITNGFLGLADKSLHAISDPDGDPFNRTVKYCTVFAVLVLALVVVKRSSTVAQCVSKVE